MAKIFENISVKEHNSFSTDVVARKFVEFSSFEDLRDTLTSGRSLIEGNWYLLGGGNNTLFTKDFDGVLIHPASQGIQTENENSDHVIIRAEAGVEWDDLVAWSVERGYWGLENLSIIPGQVGAAPVQNIGAYGAEAKDTILSVEMLDTLSMSKITLDNAACQFAYRHSIFKHFSSVRMAGMVGNTEKVENTEKAGNTEQTGNMEQVERTKQSTTTQDVEKEIIPIITSVRFRLSKTPQPNLHYGALTTEVKKLGGPSLKNIRQAVINIRESKLPDPKVLGNAGSFFKNPVVATSLAERLKSQWPDMPTYSTNNEQETKLAAGWLIEQSGWKGRSLGNAAVHDKQALVLVNKTGKASGQEIITLAGEVVRSVKEKFGVEITPEVNIL